MKKPVNTQFAVKNTLPKIKKTERPICERQTLGVRFLLYNPGNQAIPPTGTLGFPSSDYSEFGFIGVLFSLIYIRAKFYARKKFILFPEKEIKIAIFLSERPAPGRSFPPGRRRHGVSNR